MYIANLLRIDASMWSRMTPVRDHDVVQDSNTAKALAFNKDVRSRCVTLEGDDFNPSGTLTGDSNINLLIPGPSFGLVT